MARLLGLFEMRTYSFALGVLLASVTGAVACPDFDLPGVEAYEITGPKMRHPRFYNVVAGGDFDLRLCRDIRAQSDVGKGVFPDVPDFSFEVSELSGLRLVVSVVSECESVLLVHAPFDGWFYDADGTRHRDAQVSIPRPMDGPFDVWVGTSDGALCNAHLRMETFAR